MSRRFGRVLPLLEDVPGFSGIRIHTGNVIDDTEGCILVGRRISGQRIAESRIAFTKLMTMLERAHGDDETIAIEIRNPERGVAYGADKDKTANDEPAFDATVAATASI